MYLFPTDSHGHPLLDERTATPVRCDGCNTALTAQPGPAQRRLIPSPYSEALYRQPPGELFYVACTRGVLCLDLAELADELHYRHGCPLPACWCRAITRPTGAKAVR
ncbi:hypothetical protein [Actinoplanes sp. NBRC 101535]|uniref:hypothetical protein n=1 Tax=Actinoplanes sp. NBRC 101535 TaxID=3032196 RepID=UPI0024A1F1C0|nr:hypothetical protein [Actinoplanes sp. NBRC 101535]GLY08297.1 hypothetical protein Acsp01_86760 [Actinoplanes sp. NBRC 101535]